MERAKIVPVILLVIAAFAFLFFSVRTSIQTEPADIGLSLQPVDKSQAAPDWNLKNAATGVPVRLSDETKQRPVVFSFWATWCGPCRMELPHLDRVAQKFGSRVAFYGINSHDSSKAIAAYVKENDLHLTMLKDPTLSAATDYGAETLPMLIVVDTHGKVRAVVNGYDPGVDLNKALSKMLDTLLAHPASQLS